MLSSLHIAMCVFLIGFSTAKQLPLSKPGQAVNPVKNTPWIHVFYTPVLQPKGSSSCLDASGKIILTKTFASPCSSFSSADSPDGKASHIWNEKLEPCGFEDKVFKCGKGVENANFTVSDPSLRVRWRTNVNRSMREITMFQFYLSIVVKALTIKILDRNRISLLLRIGSPIQLFLGQKETLLLCGGEIIREGFFFKTV
jgi:hypothetical protein